MKPNIPQYKKVDAKLLTKSIAPSGCIYLRLLNDLPDSDSEDDCLDTPAFGDSQRHITDTFPLSPRVDSDCKSNFSNSADVSGTVCASVSIPRNSESKSAPVVIVDEIKCPFNIDLIITKAKSLEICNPVELLRFLEAEIVTGRPLQLKSVDDTLEGKTNYITVDIDRILETTMRELEFIDNYRITFQIYFQGEDSVDFGGPRKEWLRLVMQAIKSKYFNHDLPLSCQVIIIIWEY